MAKYEIKIKGNVHGAVVNEGVLQVAGPSTQAEVRDAIAELLRVTATDPQLTGPQAVAVRKRVKDLEAETAEKQKPWNADRLRTLLGDITALAATTGATAAAVEAVRTALGALIH